MGVYEPAEDSYLMQKYVRELALGRVLDMGTGSGIQALTAITNPNAHFVLAVDTDPEAIQQLQVKITAEKIRKLKVQQSNLFSNVEGQYNLIILNPPYLPQDKGIDDAAIYGGKKGYEMAERFFHDAGKHLFPDGKILFLFSSLTNKNKIEEIVMHHLFQFQQLEQQKHAFEELYLYLVEKSPLLRELEKKGIEDIHYFTHGKRGNIYTGIIDQSKFIKKYLPRRKNILKVAIKAQRSESKAVEPIQNEAKWLQLVNVQGIGPWYLFQGKNYVVYQFVEGDYIADWIAQHTKKEIIVLFKNLLAQCFILDTMKVTKEELHHPFKHILVTSLNQPVLLDFERCHTTPQPQNVTQLVEFICRLREELQKKGIKANSNELRNLAKEYKEQYYKIIIEQIIASLKIR